MLLKNLFHYFLLTIKMLPNLFSTFDSFKILILPPTFFVVVRGDKETFFKGLFVLTEKTYIKLKLLLNAICQII